ncbi:hypothetical protein D3C87_475840 [compost metagenome]
MLSIEDIATATQDADDFVRKHGECGLPFESLVLMCFIKHHQPKTASAPANHPQETPPHTDEVPDWFSEGVKRYAGQKVTASTILSGLQRATNIGALRQAGAWLRKLYGEPIRSGGQTLFAVAGRQVSEAKALEYTENDNAFDPAIPLGTRAIAFAAREKKGRYKPEQIAVILGHKGTPDEAMEIGKALTKYGFPHIGDGVFDIRPLT